MRYFLMTFFLFTSPFAGASEQKTRSEQIHELIKGIADGDSPASLKLDEKVVNMEVLNPNRGSLDCVQCGDGGFTFMNSRSRSWRLNLENGSFVLRRKLMVPTVDSSGWNFGKLRTVDGVYARPSDSQVKKLLEIVIKKANPTEFVKLSPEEIEKRIKKANAWLDIVNARIRNKWVKNFLLGTFGVAGAGAAACAVYWLCNNWNAALDRLKV